MRDIPVDEWLETLAARTPTPGGGAVAALAAASAAALIGMVTQYTTGEKWADREAKMKALSATAEGWRERALDLAREDELAFDAVGRDYALPKETEAEKEVRRVAIQVALVGAADPPIRIATLSSWIVGTADLLIGVANPNVLSDIGVAAALAEAAINSAMINIAVNVSKVTDVTTRTRLAAHLVDGTASAEMARDVTRRVLAAVAP